MSALHSEIISSDKSASMWIQALSERPTGCLQCFDTVGLVIWPVKIVPDMTYNVFGGTLNLAQSINARWQSAEIFAFTFIAFDLMTFDLWPWKPFQLCPLTWRKFVPSFGKIPIMSHEAVLTNNGLNDWARFNIPPNTLLVILGTGFYGSNDPTNSVKSLSSSSSSSSSNVIFRVA